MNQDQTIDDLLAKYLANETDTHEADIVGEWMGTSKDNHKIFEQSKFIFDGVSSLKNQKTVDVDAAWNKLNIGTKTIDNQEVKSIIKINWINNFLKIAAVLVMLFGLWFVAAKQFVVPKNDVLSFKTGNVSAEKILIHYLSCYF
jgi:transmembrane sensor